MSYFECFSVTVSTIYCSSPELSLFSLRNWVSLYIIENENRCAQLSRSSFYRFTFLCLSFRHLLQNKQTVKVPWISIHQTFEERRAGFKVSSWFLKIMKLVEHRIAKKCHEFHDCCRWLHHHYSRGCHVRFYLTKQPLALTTWF